MIEHLLCDLDGVLWRADEPIPGAAAALQRLSRLGTTTWFVTNNSNRPVHHYEDRLVKMGLAARGRVITSALSAATLIEPGCTVMACAGPGVWEALSDRGATVVGAESATTEVDAVVVGLHREFDYVRLANASRAVRAGATLIGTNSDPTYPTPGGAEPGGGAILAAVSAAAATDPILAGKPSRAMADLVTSLIGATNVTSRIAMVGDRPSTDGRFAEVMGIEYWRVGDLPDGEQTEVVPVHRVGTDLSALVEELLGGVR